MNQINLSASKLNKASPEQPATPPPGTKKGTAHYPIRTKLLVAILLIAFIPLGFLFYIDYLFLREFVADTQQAPLASAANQSAINLDKFIDDNVDLITQAADRSALINYLIREDTGLAIIADRVKAEEALQNLAQQTGRPSVAILNSDGENLLDTDRNAVRQNERNTLYFQESFQAGQNFVSPVLFETTGEAFIYFSAPLRNNREETIGVVRARYSADVLQNLLVGQSTLAGSSVPLLIDENDMILSNLAMPALRYKLLSPRETGEIEQLQTAGRLPPGAPLEAYTNLNNLKEGLDSAQPNQPTFTTQFNSTEQGQAAVKKMATRPWRVVFFQPESAFDSVIGKWVFTLAVIWIVLAVLTFFVAFNVSRYLTEPILRLADVSRQVAGGAFGLHVPVETHDEVGLVAYAFNQVTGQMRELMGNIDRIISDRTQALGSIVRSLETSTKIGRQITTILNREELLRQVVNRIQVEFNFYYTHIYLVDQETGDLVIAEGSGEVGRRLKERGHRLKEGEGIVGTVASSNEFFLSNDVSRVLNFVPNEELPETRSELALPLRKGDRVLGVLDIQDDKINRFTSAEVSLMQSIANQTAIAIDNARLLSETQTALKEVERLNRRLTREGWDQFGEDLQTSGYRFLHGATMPLTPEVDNWGPMKLAAAERQLIKQSNGHTTNKAEGELAVPLILRGEVIGMLGVKRENAARWGDEEVAAIEAVANQVTLALENARLSKEQEKTILQLKEVDRLKDEFLTSMSHELRTPLNSIIGFADVILQGIDGEVNALALNDVRLIHNSGKHLLALINDVLDLAKIEAGKMELVREELPIEIVVNDVMASTNALVLSKPVTVVKEIEKDLPDIYVDETRFKQVLINLISNASKFTDQGQVTVRVARSPDNPTNFVLFSVIDTGIGIPANMVQTVFDRFGQVASKRTSKVGGTGLGLPICKQLVEMHGGTIGVTSQEGAGSNFYFTMPFVGADLGEDNTTAVIEKLIEATKRL